ncbi:transmembrane protein 45A-like [Megalops cyprinoides]|uniref:transmembrane protein 45A-like n=1 Tax=Megalops cyprinoides TaxID=118141 RepID=UPI001864390C|nr:transmembrane protein 45A-like [Megalops cyprinoides]
MGNFKGHALPGSFFLIAGLWWAGKFSFCYATRSNKSVGFLASKARQRYLEVIEASVMLFFSVTGMLAEQFVSDGPWLRLYDYTEQRWDRLMNWQHATMYLFFGLAGSTALMVHTADKAPLAADRMMLATAFFTEGFLFLYHLHGRALLDVHVHQLLLYAIFSSALTTFLEVFQRGNVLLELLRAALCLLQGTWFWQIGFVLYPPSSLEEWDLKDHNNVMFITMCYCWHLAFALLAVSVVYCTVCWLVRSRFRRMRSAEMGLLKTMEQESEDEV